MVKKIEIIELIDDDDIVMEEKNNDVIENGQFPPNIQSKDFFESLSQTLTICQMCKDSFCLYDAKSSINCEFCAGKCNNSTCELKHIGINCGKSQCFKNNVIPITLNLIKMFV